MWSDIAVKPKNQALEIWNGFSLEGKLSLLFSRLDMAETYQSIVSGRKQYPTSKMGPSGGPATHFLSKSSCYITEDKKDPARTNKPKRMRLV